ncbi:sensor histidine kinase [Actinokineospora enzanensis]|uniref:sensor histidine kinase n=1 Tax=Actinokineospora enzanensis TaxID=155975 RepID=UPI00037D33D8|nr:HAMP domain-containing sensor histidine kinase [Actinokineospora enzanensis]
MRSLRARLILAFALLGGLTAAAVAGTMYVRARNIVLEKAQSAAVAAFTEKVGRMTVLDPDELSDRDSAGMILRVGRPPDGSLGLDVPADLRTRVLGGVVAWQRVIDGGQPVLVIGMRVSDVEFYTSRDLGAEEDGIRQLALLAWLIGGCSLLPAAALALVAARAVLRPVRELRGAAGRLGDGDLGSRVEVRGADELAAVAETFNAMADKLAKQVADARRFVADVSHELRTPLAAMTAVADVLDEEAAALTEDAGRAARLVSRETHNLTRLVDDLVEISRFDAGSAVLTLDEVDVAAAVSATLRVRGWSGLETDLAPVTARVDPRRLDVIVANLVGNALRHGAPPVTLTLRDEPGRVIITVADRGPGLDPAVLPHVFDRFYKADTARTRSAGSGLGLAIARENALLHGGDLHAANRPGGGALFTLRLPS